MGGGRRERRKAGGEEMTVRRERLMRGGGGRWGGALRKETESRKRRIYPSRFLYRVWINKSAPSKAHFPARPPVVIEYLREHPRVAVEEVLVEHRVVVGERLRQAGEARGRDLAQRRLVGLEPDAAHVQGYAVLPVHGAAEAWRVLLLLQPLLLPLLLLLLLRRPWAARPRDRAGIGSVLQRRQGEVSKVLRQRASTPPEKKDDSRL